MGYALLTRRRPKLRLWSNLWKRNPSLAKGFLKTQNARERGRRQWEEIAVRLNSLASRPPANGPLPSQRTEFSTLTERFLRVEEHQVETQRTFAQILQTCVERNAERDRMLAEAKIVVGKGLDALAQATSIKRD
ncbi:hypothetical protein ACJJTC_016641 [Scirpophaga incertulas]